MFMTDINQRQALNNRLSMYRQLTNKGGCAYQQNIKTNFPISYDWLSLKNQNKAQT